MCEVPTEAVPASCTPLPGQNSCTIGRENLLLYHPMIFWLSVNNTLGEVDSEPLCADPIDLGVWRAEAAESALTLHLFAALLPEVGSLEMKDANAS